MKSASIAGPATGVDSLIPVHPADEGVRLRRGYLIAEILLVLGLSLGRAGVFSVVEFVADLTSGVPLAEQTTTLNPSASPRPCSTSRCNCCASASRWSSSAWSHICSSAPARACEPSVLTPRSRGGISAEGAVLALLIGGTGLVWYLIAYNAGINLNVAAQGLPDEWWRTPVLVLGALENAVLEEVVVLGFVLHRLRQLEWSWTSAIVTSALIRGTYHLYQGLGGFVGNVVMGLFFGWLFKRWGRVMPMIVAHALIDTVAFIGYALLAGKVSWLPG